MERGGDGSTGRGGEDSHGTRVVLDWAGRRDITADHRPWSIVGLGVEFRGWEPDCEMGQGE